jgi:ribosomal protein S18 acetylase RimI-like enzyme
MMGIGLGSLVVTASGSSMAMVVVATDGEQMYCVSVDKQKSIRQWVDRALLKQAVRRPLELRYAS